MTFSNWPKALSSEEQVTASSPPTWADRIAQAYDGFAPSATQNAAVTVDRKRPEALDRVPLVRWIFPLASKSIDRFESFLDGPHGSELGPSAVDGLVGQLLLGIHDLASRTLVLELNVQRVLDLLQGETPQERFRCFVERLETSDYALELANQYPSLIRAIDLRIQQWLETSIELTERVAADRAELDERTEAEEPLGPVVEIQTGLGDRHEGGRTVSIVRFENGARWVYKPRSVGAEAAFFQLLRWLDQSGFPIHLKGLRVLERESYGWVEFARSTPCESTTEMELYFERLGALVALLYVLEATDMHHENILAQGAHPILVDLETLMQPIVGDPAPTVDRPRPATASVLRSGLLPRRLWADEGSAGFDVSGMSPGNTEVLSVEQLQDEMSDEARYSEGRYEQELRDNLPMLDGQRPAPSEYEEFVVRGFRQMYDYLRAHRDALLDPNGPLDPLRSTRVRVVVRPTELYARVLRTSFHPDYLQDGSARESLFERLREDADRIPEFAQTTDYEVRALARCDVPRFAAEPGSRDLWTDDGERLHEFFGLSSWELVEQRFDELSDDDRERQEWLVRASLQSTVRREENPLPLAASPRATIEPSAPEVDPDLLRTTAIDVAQRLSSLSVDRDSWINWFHVMPGADLTWQIEPLDHDLYGGLSGMALFFAQIGRIANDREANDRARRCLESAREWFEVEYESILPSESLDLKNPEPATSSGLRVGAFSGGASWVYTLTYLGALWNDDALLDEAVLVSRALAPHIASDKIYDLIGGSAGFLAVLLELGAHRPDAELREIASQAANHLLEQSEWGADRTAWWTPPPEVSPTPLTGFAHGASGIAWALMRYSERSPDPRILDLVECAVRFERQSFLREGSGWRDLRADRPVVPFAWCHGAPGIGLARAGMLDCAESVERSSDPNGWRDRLHEDLKDAVELTLTHGLGGGHSLCHGTLGNLETVRDGLTSGALPTSLHETAQAAVATVTAEVVARLQNGEYKTGVTLVIDQPGMMLGLAGIGYGLLRAYDPAGVPSILTLSCPSPLEAR